jgi:hypothetical protein
MAVRDAIAIAFGTPPEGRAPTRAHEVGHQTRRVAMTFTDYIKRGWDVVQLKTDAIKELAADEGAIGPAIGILAIGGVCAGIGSLNFLAVFFLPFVRVIGAFVFLAIAHFAATTFFGGKGRLMSLAIPVFCGSLVTWVAIIPLIGPWFLSFLAGLWMLVIMVLSIENTYEGIDRGKAIASVAVPFVLFLIIAMLFVVMGVGLLAATGVLAR